MQPAVLSPLPSWNVVIREQFRSVGLSLRREALAALGLVGLATVWLTWLQLNTLHGAQVPLTPEAGIPAAVLALLVPMAVWKGEDPARRGYHRAMPVNHAAHAVARSLSGLVWMSIAIGAWFVWLGLVSAFTGGEVAVREGWRWLVPFTGGAVMYLLGSALTLSTAHPWRWLGGGFVGYLFLNALRVADGSRSLFEAVNVIFAGKYGLGTVVSGLSPVYSGPEHYAWHYPVASVWLLATWLWLALAISVFLYAAYRQPER